MGSLADQPIQINSKHKQNNNCEKQMLMAKDWQRASQREYDRMIIKLTDFLWEDEEIGQLLKKYQNSNYSKYKIDKPNLIYCLQSYFNIFPYITYLSNYTRKMNNNALDTEIATRRIELSIRTTQISQFRYEKSRSKNVNSMSQFFKNSQRGKDSIVNDLQNSLFLIKYWFDGNLHKMMAPSIGNDYIATLVSSSHSSYFVEEWCNIQVEALNCSKTVMNVVNIFRIDVSQVYEQIQYDLILLKVMSGREKECFGYDFKPLPYQERRIKLIRVSKYKYPKKLYTYDYITKQLLPLTLYQFLDVNNNFIMQNSNLPKLLPGSPIFQQIEYEYFLVGLYCSRCQAPVDDYHHIILFNPKILEKIKGSLQIVKAEKVLLNFTIKTGKIAMGQLQILTKWNFQNLIVLELNSNRIGVKGVKKLVRAKWNHITNISLDGNEIDDSCISYLSRTTWKRISSVSLLNNLLGNEGVNAIGNCAWKQITFINLYKNYLNEFGIRKFLKFDWTILSILNLQKSKSDLNVLKLQKYFGSKLSKLQKFSI